MAKRNRKGQYVKSGRKASPKRRKSTALARRSSTGVARRSTGIRTYTVRRRRSGGGGGGVGGALSYLGGPQVAEVVASGALGWAVGNRRATVETIVNYAPDTLRAVGGYGVIALGAGFLSRMGVGRKYLAPLARAATIIAVNKLTTRGAWYEPGQLSASLSGDDDDVSGDMDVGALDVGADDVVAAGDD